MGAVPLAGPVRDPRAATLRQRYHQRFAEAELPVPVEAIAQDLLGLRVSESDDLEVSGMLLPAKREIWLNGREAEESPGRRRFTLAHELGHWVCHVLEGKTAPVYCRPVDVTEAADRALEREANGFAAELLMPEELVREEFRRAATPAELAEWFGVSAEAMHWRLFNFGLVQDVPR